MSELVDYDRIAEEHGAEVFRSFGEYLLSPQQKMLRPERAVLRAVSLRHEVTSIPFLRQFVRGQLPIEIAKRVLGIKPEEKIRRDVNDKVQVLVLPGLGAANGHMAHVDNKIDAPTARFTKFDQTIFSGDVRDDALSIAALLEMEPNIRTIILAHSRGALVAAGVKAYLNQWEKPDLVPGMVSVAGLMNGARSGAHKLGQTLGIPEMWQLSRNNSVVQNIYDNLPDGFEKNTALVTNFHGDRYVNPRESLLTPDGEFAGTVIARPGFYPHHAAALNPNSPLMAIAIDIVNEMVAKVRANLES